MAKKKKKKKSGTTLRATNRSRASSRNVQSYDDGPSFFWRLTKWLFILGLWCSIILICVLAWFAADLPDITKAAAFEKQTSIIVKAADGSEIARYGETKGKSVNVEDMPKHLVEAVLATEDRRFYNHPGVDVFGILRAIIVNAWEGRTVQGGSTITQQLAKNLFLTHERTLKRKIQEALLALWLEHQLTKDEILSAYMNRVYLGSGVYGMDAAAQLYFEKPLNDIDLREAATLAGLLKAPSKYSPLNNPLLARQRADVVLIAMADAGYITEKEAKGLAKSMPKPRSKPVGERANKYFADWVIEGLDDLIGTPEMDLIIETTMDSSVQSGAEQSLNSVLVKDGAAHKISQGAVMVMRPDGAVLAMVGGRDYSRSEFNRCVQSVRAPGSSFKPFVFLTALERGWYPSDRILDAPITEGKYRPANFGGKYYGEVTIGDALALSMNTATVRLMKEVGAEDVLATAKKMGILSKLEPNLSTGLGSSGVTMLEMTTAYASLANGGNRVYPYAIKKISDAQGRVLYQRRAPGSHERIVAPRDAANITMMMQGVIERGTGQRARLPFPAAGKTGTSQDSRDTWFVGFTDRAAISVWMGNDDNSPMNDMTGGSFPAQIWRDVMNKTYNRYDALTFSGGFVRYNDSYDGGPSESANDGDTGISGLLGRLISGGNESAQKQPRKSDFSNLNE